MDEMEGIIYGTPQIAAPMPAQRQAVFVLGYRPSGRRQRGTNLLL
jgi:hypothetical protein